MEPAPICAKCAKSGNAKNSHSKNLYNLLWILSRERGIPESEWPSFYDTSMASIERAVQEKIRREEDANRLKEQSYGSNTRPAAPDGARLPAARGF